MSPLDGDEDWDLLVPFFLFSFYLTPHLYNYLTQRRQIPMRLFFKYLGLAFEDFFVHLLLAIKALVVNLFRAVYHPRKHSVQTGRQGEHNSRPKFIEPNNADSSFHFKKKRRHRGGKKHRGGRKHRHHHHDGNNQQ
jgi:hypothetical protein